MKIFATSDTHNKKEWIHKIPKDVDIVLHAGDITDMGSELEIELIIMELNLLGIPVVVCPGNHDMELQYNTEFTSYLKETYSNVHVSKKAEHVVVDIAGNKTKIFVNPYVVEFGHWAFGVKEEDLEKYMPDYDTDIILCHCPPSHEAISCYDWHDHGIVDIGNKAITKFLEESETPMLVFCGHNHLPYISGASIGNSYVWNVATHQLLLTEDSI